MPAAGGRIPIAFVVGFLGSGKTTLLQQIARADARRRLLFLINEFSAADVDGRLVRKEGADVIEMPGGSIFCRCLVSSFLAQLQRVAELARERVVEGLVIEATGMADPRVARELLRETGLEKAYELRRIVAVADPRRIVRLARVLPVLRAQIEAADLVLLNKCDIATAAEVNVAETWIRAVRPEVELHRCVRAKIEFDLFQQPVTPSRAIGALAPCRDPAFDAIELTPTGEIKLESLVEAVRAMSADLLRLKGFVRIQGSTVLVQWDGETFYVEAASVQMEPGLAAVVRGGSAPIVRERLEVVLNA